MMGNELRRNVLSRGLSSYGVVWIDEFRIRRGIAGESSMSNTNMVRRK